MCGVRAVVQDQVAYRLKQQSDGKTYGDRETATRGLKEPEDAQLDDQMIAVFCDLAEWKTPISVKEFRERKKGNHRGVASSAEWMQIANKPHLWIKLKFEGQQEQDRCYKYHRH